MTRPIVLIESPFRDGDRARNLRYLQWCMYDSASRGECPVASHAIGPLFWQEDEEHRAMGRELRDALSSRAYKRVGYRDIGTTPGMAWGRVDETRHLDTLSLMAFDRGEWPPGTVRLVPAKET